MTQARVFAVGDVVRLRSGGPRMTVEDLGTAERPLLRCVWFAPNGPELNGMTMYAMEGPCRDAFPPGALLQML